MQVSNISGQNMKNSRRNNGDRKGNKVPTVKSETAKDLRAFGKINASTNVVRRRVCGAQTNISTNGAGLLVASTFISSSGASASADFTQLAGLFTSYRVAAMKITLMPYYPVPFYNGVGTIVVPASVATSEFRGGLGGATYQAIFDGSKSRVLSGYKSYTLTCDYAKDNDAQLWTPTTTAIPGAEAYGLLGIGTATAASVSALIWAVNPEYLIEFRTTF